MDGARALTTDRGAEGGCDRCGSPPGAVPPVTPHRFRGAPLRRCDHCGLRSVVIDGAARLVETCRGCGLAHLASPTRASAACPDCEARGGPPELPAGALAAAGERELRVALSSSLRLVELPSRSEYLDRLARGVAAAISGAPPRVSVAIFRDSAVRTLALPSGTLLVSTGCLAGLEDEAELAFVLGHELAHVAAGHAAAGLGRIGLRSLAESPSSDSVGASWARVADDLMSLGYGVDLERAADRSAVEAVVALGYDPGAPAAWLDRVKSRVDGGDADLADLACSHPPARDRLRRVGEHLRSRFPTAGPGRTNREVFRRAAGREVLASGLTPLAGGLADPAGAPQAERGRPLRRTILWTAVGIALLTGAFLVLGLLLSR